MNDHPRTYRVRPSDKRPLLELFEHGLRLGGAQLLETPRPDIAPFEYLIETPDGELLRLVAYVFRATKYHSGEKRERPLDEHRFQIKYGGDFHDYHHLRMPPPGDSSWVTVFIGVHLEEGILVGCDPAMHNPTWFSKSVEFKDEHVERTHEKGWFGWERDRAEGRRKRDRPLLDNRTEAVIAFTPEHLVRYIELERSATGLDPGERLLLADELAARAAELASRADRHPLEVELGISAREILDMIEEEFRLKVAVRGSAAQWHLGELLARIPGVAAKAIDADGRADYEIRYLSRRRIVTVECKNVLRKQRLGRAPVVEYQKTRASKTDPLCGRFYTFDHCDVLAACLHPITEHWSFRFCPSLALAPHPRCPNRVQPRIAVAGAQWADSIEPLLDRLTAAG
jgi:hypothetical protein